MAWLTHPFVLGLGLGLILALVLWIQGIWKRRSLVKDIANLRDHLLTGESRGATAAERGRADAQDALLCKNFAVRRARRRLPDEPPVEGTLAA